MRLLFVDSAREYLGPQPGGPKPQPTLGLACVSSFLQADGHQVTVLDLGVFEDPDQALERELAQFDPEVVAANGTIPSVRSAFEVFRAAKAQRADRVTVLGGPVASFVDSSELLGLCPDLDYVVVGEGEVTTSELVRGLSTGQKPGAGEIEGLVVPARNGGPRGSGGSINIATPLRHRRLMTSAELEAAPSPDWSLFRLGDYRAVPSYRFGYPVRTLPIEFGRGCPYRCTFCSSVFGRSLRTKSSAAVVADLVDCWTRHGVRTFNFVDPVATADRPRFLDLCRSLSASPAAGEISFTIETRADLVTPEIIHAAAEAGCEAVGLGLESGSQAVLDHFEKNTLLPTYTRAFEVAADAGIHIRTTVILGSPSETPETLAETEAFIEAAFERFNIEVIPYFLAIYPGTSMQKLVDEGVNGVRWKPGARDDWAGMRRDRPLIDIPGLSDEELHLVMGRLRSLRRQALERVPAFQGSPGVDTPSSAA